MIYKKRILDSVLDYKLKTKGAVLITGPKWCGKTTTAKRIAKSFINMQDPINKSQYLSLANISPLELLKGETPRLIDEWQIAPVLWDVIRQEVDKRQLFNQFILTGSSVLDDFSKISHSGIGRISIVTMRPMSLFESGQSNGEISLSNLFNNDSFNKSSTSPLSFDDITYLICRGGWPLATLYEGKIALEQAKDYYNVLIKREVIEIDGVKRSKTIVDRLLKSYARNILTPASNTILLDDINGNQEIVSLNTLKEYIEVLKKLYVIEDLETWNPIFRSKTRLRTTPLRNFIDPSIAAAALRMSPKDLLNDIKTAGFLFESLVIRDLKVYADFLDGNVYHYHDNTNLEVDAIIHLNDGRWGAIEIKLGSNEIPKAIKNLKRLVEKIDLDKMNKPSFLMVLTATKYAYKNEEGIWIVPIGTLKY